MKMYFRYNESVMEAFSFAQLFPQKHSPFFAVRLNGISYLLLSSVQIPTIQNRTVSQFGSG